MIGNYRPPNYRKQFIIIAANISPGFSECFIGQGYGPGMRLMPCMKETWFGSPKRAIPVPQSLASLFLCLFNSKFLFLFGEHTLQCLDCSYSCLCTQGYSCQGSWDHMQYQVLHPHWPHAKQEPHLLYSCYSPIASHLFEGH